MSLVVSRRYFLRLSAFAFVAGRSLAPAEDKIPAVPANLDHVLLGASDLDRGIAWLETRSGVRAAIGGVHPGRGTRNALLSLGGKRYLEIIAPDPAQAGVTNPMIDGLRVMQEPRLIGWAVHTDDIEGAQKRATAGGLATDDLRDGSRARPDGKLLRWRSCNLKNDLGGALPFFIQWSADSVHPSQDAPAVGSLERFWIESPQSGDLLRAAQKLGLDVEIERSSSPKPVLHARIQGNKGAFELA